MRAEHLVRLAPDDAGRRANSRARPGSGSPRRAGADRRRGGRCLQIDRAAAREGLAVAAGAGRQHAVEHVDAARDRLDEIVGRADAHQIARPVGRQLPARSSSIIASITVLRLADREPADRVAVEADLDERARALRRAASDRRRPARCRTARGPAARARTRACSARPSAATAASRARSRRASPAAAMHSSSCMAMSAPSRRWISIERSGVSSMHRAVEMRAEGHAVLVDLAQLGERHHLEAAGIGQDRMRPVHEPVQAAERRDRARRRAAASGDRCCRARSRRRSRAPRRASSP